jgi:hypothetical protein
MINPWNMIFFEASEVNTISSVLIPDHNILSCLSDNRDNIESTVEIVDDMNQPVPFRVLHVTESNTCVSQKSNVTITCYNFLHHEQSSSFWFHYSYSWDETISFVIELLHMFFSFITASNNMNINCNTIYDCSVKHWKWVFLFFWLNLVACYIWLLTDTSIWFSNRVYLIKCWPVCIFCIGLILNILNG